VTEWLFVSEIRVEGTRRRAHDKPAALLAHDAAHDVALRRFFRFARSVRARRRDAVLRAAFKDKRPERFRDVLVDDATRFEMKPDLCMTDRVVVVSPNNASFSSASGSA
jgi:hypothetical protein